MRAFGFSTGALAKSDVKRALNISRDCNANAVEYSALRFSELKPLVDYLMEHGVGGFRYVAFHAPSQFAPEDEAAVVGLLREVFDKLKVHIVVHPDVIRDFSLWSQFGDMLCVENMDHRKPIGRTVSELREVFNSLPKARLCFDIGHAHELDRSMSCAYEILREFGNRIAHIHASEVSDDCAHRAFSPSSVSAFSKLVDMLPADAPVILETVTRESEVKSQFDQARVLFGNETNETATSKAI